MRSNSYQLIAIIALAILCTRLLILVFRWPQGIHRTFSQHAAHKPELVRYYFNTFAFAFPLLGWVYSDYIQQKFQIIPAVGLLFWLAIILQLLCTLVPERDDQVRLHRVYAGASGLLLPIILALITIGSSMPRNLQDTITVLLVMMLHVMAIGLKKAPQYSLIAQVAFYTLFLIAYISLVLY